jgi:hypothetical protein
MTDLAATTTPAAPGPLIEPGRGVEIDVFGRTVTGVVLWSSATSIGVDVPDLADLRSIRLGARVKARFGAHGAAMEVSCGLYPASDHLLLRVVGRPRLLQRRRHERIPLRAQLELTWRDRRANAWTHATALTQDVSLGGARLALGRGADPATDSLAPGAVLLLALSSHVGVESGARIVRADDGVARVEFIDPAEAFFPALVTSVGTRPV